MGDSVWGQHLRLLMCLILSGLAFPKRSLVRRVASPAGSHAVRADAQIGARQQIGARHWMAMPTVRLPQVRLILCMDDELQVVGIPEGVDAALGGELSAFGNRTAKKLPAESVGVAVLGLGHAAVRRCCSREPPAGAELGRGRFADGA